jgi:hypothetical protein
MRVEMIQHITGTRDGLEWPLKGGTIDLPDHEAADLIGAGLAKEATDEAIEDEADPTGDEPAPEPVKTPSKKAPAKKAAAAKKTA